jgi:DNA-binding transcriptional LysR family regulator
MREGMAAVRNASVAELGVAILPNPLCRNALAAGRLVRVRPSQRELTGIVHLVSTIRRDLSPAAGALIDQSAASLPRSMSDR